MAPRRNPAINTLFSAAAVWATNCHLRSPEELLVFKDENFWLHICICLHSITTCGESNICHRKNFPPRPRVVRDGRLGRLPAAHLNLLASSACGLCRRRSWLPDLRRAARRAAVGPCRSSSLSRLPPSHLWSPGASKLGAPDPFGWQLLRARVAGSASPGWIFEGLLVPVGRVPFLALSACAAAVELVVVARGRA
jgi:hypothetical protein